MARPGSRSPAIGIDGLRTLRRQLKAAGDDLSDLKDTHAEVLGVVLPEAERRVPHRTGRLAATVRGSATAGAAVVRAGRASVPYGPPIHWGWRDRGIAPSLFGIDAILSQQNEVVHIMHTNLTKIVSKIEGTPGP